MFRKGCSIRAAALNQQIYATEEYDDAQEAANHKWDILPYPIELPDNTPYFFIKSHIVFIIIAANLYIFPQTGEDLMGKYSLTDSDSIFPLTTKR